MPESDNKGILSDSYSMSPVLATTVNGEVYKRTNVRHHSKTGASGRIFRLSHP